MRTTPLSCCLFYRLWNRGSGNLNNLARVPWLVSGYNKSLIYSILPQSENCHKGQSLGWEVPEARQPPVPAGDVPGAAAVLPGGPLLPARARPRHARGRNAPCLPPASPGGEGGTPSFGRRSAAPSLACHYPGEWRLRAALKGHSQGPPCGLVFLVSWDVLGSDHHLSPAGQVCGAWPLQLRGLGGG